MSDFLRRNPDDCDCSRCQQRCEPTRLAEGTMPGNQVQDSAAMVAVLAQRRQQDEQMGQIAPYDEVMAAERDLLLRALRLLLAAFPELAGQFSTPTQQRALRAAQEALEQAGGSKP